MMRASDLNSEAYLRYNLMSISLKCRLAACADRTCDMTEEVLEWPADPGGDGLTALQDLGFDFSRPTLIDFNVNLQNWPPS